MPTETATTTTAPEAAPATSNEAPSFTQETPSSTVENLPQSDGDFATWLSDRLEKFDKGEETAPWEQKQEANGEDKKEEDKEEVSASEETSEPEKEDDKTSEELSKEEEIEEDDSEETKNMSAAAGAKFKELKSELKEYKAKVSELEKAVEGAKSASQTSEELEELKSKLSDYEKELAVSRIEATPQYKRGVTEPTEAILESAAGLAERYKVDVRKLVNALREESVAEGSDALTELASDFSERDRVRLYRMADDLTEVARRREHMKQNASEVLAQEQEKAKAEEARMEQAYKEQSAKAAASVWKETFAEHPVISKLDKAVLQDMQKAGSESDLLDSEPDTRAYALYAGLALPHMIKQLEATTSKVAELEKALGKYKKAAPKVSGNADTTPPPNTDDGGFLDAIEKRFTLG